MAETKRERALNEIDSRNLATDDLVKSTEYLLGFEACREQVERRLWSEICRFREAAETDDKAMSSWLTNRADYLTEEWSFVLALKPERG